MKVTLVVASGVHEGKTIPINAAKFIIGRDPQCQLRPASQAVSKQHCAIILKDNAVTIQDFGSTNGTIVNDEVVRGEERIVSNNDRVKVGPLDFTLVIEATAAHKPLNPAPTEAIKKKVESALAAVQAVTETAEATASDATARKVADSKPPSNPKSTPPTKKPEAPKRVGEPNNDDIAAMLLGMGDDDESNKVPDGSTVMEMPSPVAGTAPGTPGSPSKPPAAKAPTREDTSNAASEILRKMLRRPR